MSKELKKVEKITGGLSKLQKLKGLKPKIEGELVLPRLYYQLVIFILDGTGSMTWEGKTGKSKGEEVDESVKAVLKRLYSSKNRNSFDIATWVFAEKNKRILDVTNMDRFDYNSFDFNPCSYFHENYMYEYLDDTLIEVKQVCDNYFEKHKEKNTKALIIILSDGAIKYFDSALGYFNELKMNKRITVSSVLLEDMRWVDDEEFKEETRSKLKLFASDNDINKGHKFFLSTIDPEEIRKHMIKSISTVSKID